MADREKSNRRFALIAGIFVVVLLVVVLGSLLGTCREPAGEPIDYVSPEEELGPAPGVE